MLVSILERVLITLVSFNLRLSFFLSTFLSLAISIYYRSLLFPKYHTVASLGLILIIVYYSSLLTSFEVEKIGFKYKCNNSQVDYDHYEDSRFEPRPIENIVYEKGQWKNEKSNFLFHGINLPAKTPHFPANLRNTNSSRNFYKHTTSENKPVVSFVGKPFPLDLADEHFRRLSNYGFNLIRLTVTWEAVMHEGPGIVDNEYLDYLSELVDKASNFGLYALIDPHQDVWSRFTGNALWLQNIARIYLSLIYVVASFFSSQHLLNVSVICEKETIFVSVSTRKDEKRVQKLVLVLGLLISLVAWWQVSVIFFAALCYNSISQYLVSGFIFIYAYLFHSPYVII